MNKLDRIFDTALDLILCLLLGALFICAAATVVGLFAFIVQAFA